MPESSNGRATHSAQVQAEAFQNFMGLYTAPPTRRLLLLRYAPTAVLLLFAVAWAAANLWVFGVVFVVLAVNLAWNTRSRLNRAYTEVTALGVTVHTRDTHRDMVWQDVQEVYPRTSWARFPTLRLTSGSSVALPGVGDEQALRLEQARADLVVATATRRRANPGT